MPRTCTVCRHARRETIDAALVAGEPYRHVASRTGTSTAPVVRHKRDHMPAVLYGGGRRRTEAVALDLADCDAATGALTVRSGKGRKARVVHATNGGRAALDAWRAVRGLEAGPLLGTVTKGGRVQIRRVTPQAVYVRLAALGERAGVAKFSPHDMRPSFVSGLLDAGADIATVQRLAGHANVTTTQRYDRRGEVPKRKATELLHVPYVAPRA